MLPLFLDLRSRKVVVFGGGRVALRKARYLGREADVTVVSKGFVEGFEDIGAKLVLGDAVDMMDGMIEDADMVVAATGDASINDLIVERAGRRPVNRDDDVGSFLIPSIVEREGMTIAISTIGRCPALAREMRIRLDRTIGDEHGSMLEAATTLRDELRSTVATQGEREALLRAAVSDEGVWAAAEQGPERALECMREVLSRC